jgi:hypothetical protein
MLAVGESTMFVGTFLLNLYLNEVEGLGLGPLRHGVMAPRRRGQGPNLNNGSRGKGPNLNNGRMPNQTKLAYPLAVVLLI